MARLEYVKLDEKEIKEGLARASGWSLTDGKLTRTFTFDTYLEGVNFASKVGSEADFLNHHPDIQIGWRKVEISVSTHDVGGVSPYDFELARLIDLI